MFSYYKDKRILVTGGAGFIGSHLVKKLVEHGARVTVLDNLSTGSVTNLNTVYQDVIFLEKDIRDMQSCLRAAQKQDIIFHLAAFVAAGQSVQKAEECFATNIDGTFNMLWASREAHAEKFIFSSSAAIYGPQESACHENIIGTPSSPYGHSKRIGELLCKHFQQTDLLTTLILRYFNVYGPSQSAVGDHASVLAQFAAKLQANKPITIFGNGMQTRDFIHVTTLVNHILTLAALPATYIAGETINLATGKSKTLLEMLALLKDQYPDYSNSITFKPTRAGDIDHSQADIQKLETFLNYAQHMGQIQATGQQSLQI